MLPSDRIVVAHKAKENKSFDCDTRHTFLDKEEVAVRTRKRKQKIGLLDNAQRENCSAGGSHPWWDRSSF